MQKFNGLWRIILVLILSFTLTGFLCDDEKDEDKNSCSDAAKNIITVYLDAGVSQADICHELWLNILYWDAGDEATCNAQSFPEEFKEFAFDELAEWCKEDDWAQDDIDCLSGADSLAEINNC